MAHWGIAYGCGPFYNMTWRDHSEEEANAATRTAYEHIRKARGLTHRATELENWLVETQGPPRPKAAFRSAGTVRPLG